MSNTLRSMRSFARTIQFSSMFHANKEFPSNKNHPSKKGCNFSTLKTIALIHYRPANEVCEGYAFTGVCLSTGGSWSLSWDVSVPWCVSVQGGSLPRGVSIQGGLCHGHPPYGNERAVRILLECIIFQYRFCRNIDPYGLVALVIYSTIVIVWTIA